MQVMNVIAEILKREGVSTLFCFPTTPIIEAAAAIGIRPVICRQERVGVHMADGFARVSNGRPPGVFAMQYGPGAENAFAGVATAFSDSTPVIFLPLGHARDIDEAAKMLLDAACPMILAGQGVFYAEATDELRQLAELLQAPVMTTFDGKSAFPEDHPLALGPGGGTFTGHGRHFLHKSDLVLGVGCSFTRHGIATPVFPPGKKYIHATNDSRDLHKAFAADLAILGDAKLVLGQLIEAVRDRLGAKTRSNNVAREVGAKREEWLARWHPKLNSNEHPINPYRVISEFMRVVDPAEAIVTHDSGSPREQLNPFYRATRPRGYLGWGKSHQLGTGLGLVIGAKIAAPDKFCVNFMGDAAFGMTGLDFETAVRCGVPILTIVLNNSTMAIEIPHMKLSHERHRSRDLGGWSERVEDPGQVGEAILRARRQTEDGKAC